MNANALKTISYIYLILVPPVAAALGFGIGHVSYTLYLPAWIVNVVCMSLAAWFTGLHVTRMKDPSRANLARSAFFLIIPWIMISLFAGLGPPPETAAAWHATATEQQLRYFMLATCAVFMAFGFSGLRYCLMTKGENYYSLLGITAILIATPLLILNMLYWGFCLSELFKIQVTTNLSGTPQWHLPLNQLFGSVSVAEVALTYVATFAFAVSLRKAGWMKKIPLAFYAGFSCLAFAIIVLSAFFTESLRIPGFAVSIPATPFLMPYYLGVICSGKPINSI